MGIYLDGRGAPPVRSWSEPIDATHCAVVILAETIERGGYYRSSTFRIMSRDEWHRLRWRPEREEWARRELVQDVFKRRGKGFARLEYICRAYDRET